MDKMPDFDNLDSWIYAARILVVDDNPANVELLLTILDEAGYDQVDGLTDPREVLPKHLERRYDLILLDIRMPHLDGIQVLELLSPHIRADYVPVIVLTAQNDQETRQKALHAGARDFLTKPFQHWEILLRIRNTLESRAFYVMEKQRAARLHQEVLDATAEIRETQMELLSRLGQAAEFRDTETGAHVVRMSRYCMILAKKLGLSDEAAQMLLAISPMHDVGKVGIPDSILLKPGKLTPEEFEQMKNHSWIGYTLLDGHSSELLTQAKTVALTHHEKWDGSGYPRGLKGEEIPLAGRICAVADVFDALTSRRPYKEAWPVEQAVDYLRTHAGSHFDPQVVQAFIDSLDDILLVRASHPDESHAMTAPEQQP
ncbi:two-component system response regulator [Denitratisoma sp. agr-D3]